MESQIANDTVDELQCTAGTGEQTKASPQPQIPRASVVTDSSLAGQTGEMSMAKAYRLSLQKEILEEAEMAIQPRTEISTQVIANTTNEDFVKPLITIEAIPPHYVAHECSFERVLDPDGNRCGGVTELVLVRVLNYIERETFRGARHNSTILLSTRRMLSIILMLLSINTG